MTTSRPGAAAHAASGFDGAVLTGGNMKVLSKVHLLAERHGWSMARAQGFVDGEISRRRGTPPSTYARVGIDDYCLGFRDGYYERGEPRERDKKVMSASAAADAREAAVQERRIKVEAR